MLPGKTVIARFQRSKEIQRDGLPVAKPVAAVSMVLSVRLEVVLVVGLAVVVVTL